MSIEGCKHGPAFAIPQPCADCERERVEGEARDKAVGEQIASLSASRTPPAPEEHRMRELRQMFSDGVNTARTYGVNAYDLHTEELERNFQNALARITAGTFNVQLGPAAPPAPEAAPPQEEEGGDANQRLSQRIAKRIGEKPFGHKAQLIYAELVAAGSTPEPPPR